MDQARIGALQRMPIFGGIRDDVLQFLIEQATSVRLAAGEYFFRENDAAQSLFVLESGRVAILKQWNGQSRRIVELGPGDCFGEMALMDLFPRSASAQAIEPCSALELSAAAFFKLYERDLEQFAIVQMNLGREVSRRLRAADERLFRATLGEPVSEIDGLPGPLT